MQKQISIKKFFNNSFEQLGVSHSLRQDLYYYVMETTWPRVYLFFLLFYILGNLLFAALYYLVPGSLSTGGETRFLDCFYFSVQTMATIGYGTLSPQSDFANFLVVLETFIGLISVAIMTGLVFAKISRPYAKIRFGKNAIINNFNGEKSLSIRMGNLRGNDIVEANVNLTALIDEKTDEGQLFRRIYDLKLVRSYTPFFKLSWSLFHPLDEHSPIKDYDNIKESLQAVAVTVTGHDGTFSTTIYGRHIYTPEEIVEDRYFKDIMKLNSKGEISIDYNQFDDFEDESASDSLSRSGNPS